ncbi:MAG: GNAT family N-acetyltransferase [Candidatus Dormibacteria bacterium]
MPDSKVEVVVLPGTDLEEVRPLLLDLLVEDQAHYDHEKMDRQQIDGSLLGAVRPGFQGENVILVVRDPGPQGPIVALCWCVIYDPGTGLEGEVAEVYVKPEHRGRGHAKKLLVAAVDLFRRRRVTFASVWTHADNEAAVRLYRSAGFGPTEQLVLTWLPQGEAQA